MLTPQELEAQDIYDGIIGQAWETYRGVERPAKEIYLNAKETAFAVLKETINKACVDCVKASGYNKGY